MDNSAGRRAQVGDSGWVELSGERRGPPQVPGFDAVELLGFGASGEVWLAAGAGLEGRDRLRREAAVLAGVDHPHVARLLAVHGDGDDVVLVLDLAAGGSLARLLATRGRLSPGEVVTVGVPLAEALAAVHAQGLLHGDVTPGNVLFTADGRPVLSDLGVSRLLGVAAEAQQPVHGTSGYLAPEVVAGGAPGPAADVHGLAATCLASEGVRVTMVANRTYERAQAVAEELGARALTLDQAWEHFATADIVLSSTAAPHAVVTWERVAAAIERRGRRPLCILDVAVPRDVEPAVGRLENVFLYDIDDLQTVAAQATAERRKEIPAAEHIVTEEVERFWTWYGGLAVVPVLKEFRGRLDQVRAQELERALKRLAHLAPEDLAQIEQFSHALLNKFLHQPTIALKQAAHVGRGYGLLEALKRLFGLEQRDGE